MSHKYFVKTQLHQKIMLLHNEFGSLVSPQVICNYLPSFLIRALYVYCVGDAEHMPIDRDFALAFIWCI